MNADHSVSYIRSLILLKAFVPGFRPIKESFIDVLKKRDLVSTYPAYWLIIGFGNIVYQIVLPSSLDSSIKLPEFHFPLPFDFDWPFGAVDRNVEDLTSDKLVRGKVIPINYSYDKIEKKKNILVRHFLN